MLVSFDGGITFIARSVPTPLNSRIATLAVDPQDSAGVWVGLEGTPRVLRSLDRGVTWSNVTPPANFFSRCVALDVGPTDSSRVIAVNENYFAHVTLDGGATWVLELGLGARPISAEFAPDGRLFVGTSVPISAATSPHALFPSSNGAANGSLAIGTPSVAANVLALRARRAPFNSVGLFLVSDQLGFVPGAGGSSGALCLAGAIGRFGPNAVQSGTTGQFERHVDLTARPRPTGPLAVQSGETCSFQVWFRDTNAGGATSNFSDAVSVRFTP